MNAAVLFAAVAISAAAMLPPRVTSAVPPGAQRGTEVDFVLRGERLGNATSLLCATQGLEVLSFTPGKALIPSRPKCSRNLSVTA